MKTTVFFCVLLTCLSVLGYIDRQDKRHAILDRCPRDQLAQDCLVKAEQEQAAIKQAVDEQGRILAAKAAAESDALDKAQPWRVYVRWGVIALFILAIIPMLAYRFMSGRPLRP